MAELEEVFPTPKYPTLDDYFPKTGKKRFRPIYDRLRPPPGIKYFLEETRATLDAGITQMRLVHTKARYEPGQKFTLMDEVSSKSAQVAIHSFEKSRCRGPVWEFLDEEEYRIKKAGYRESMVKSIENREIYKKKEQGKKLTAHKRAMMKIGPDWYQELSNNQFKIADELEKILIKDYRLGTIINTQEALTTLGIVLRPNHTKVEYALKKCWNCPVEFLLTLFKILDPHRKTYSVNDRILLSAVVHLRIKQTLKQLHLRIPSPEKKEEENIKLTKKVKKCKTDTKNQSPFLTPMIFKSVDRKEYIYKNRHKEYAWMKYFDYKEEMYEEYEDPLPPTPQKTEDGSPIIPSKYSQPPKIPVRLITRIAPKPRMLKRLIRPGPYINKCDAIEIGKQLEAEKKPEKIGKVAEDTLNMDTEIDLTKLCACQGKENRQFTLNIKISTSLERIKLAQDIKPFAETTGELKIMSVEKKDPCVCDDLSNKISIEANFEQKFECICEPEVEQEVCDCAQQTGQFQEPSVSKFSVCGCVGSSEPSIESQCGCGDGKGTKKQQPQQKQSCGFDTTLSCNSHETPVKQTCACTGKAGAIKLLKTDAIGCVCPSSSESGSLTTSSTLTYSDLDPCECLGKKKVRRNEEGCRCSKAIEESKVQVTEDKGGLCACESRGPKCTCLTGDGTIRKAECTCLIDENSVCKCAAKIDLDKICSCEVPNKICYRNLPEKLCLCKNPNLNKIDKYYRCRCLHQNFEDLDEKPSPNCGCMDQNARPNKQKCLEEDSIDFGGCDCQHTNTRKVSKSPQRNKTAEKGCGCSGKPVIGSPKSCLDDTIVIDTDNCDCVTEPYKEPNPYQKPCTCGQPKEPPYASCVCDKSDPNPDYALCTCGGHKPPRKKVKMVSDAISKMFELGKKDREMDKKRKELVKEHQQEALDENRVYYNLNTLNMSSEESIKYSNFKDDVKGIIQGKRSGSLDKRKKNEIKFLSTKQFISDHGLDDDDDDEDYSFSTNTTFFEEEIVMAKTCKCDKVFNAFMLEHDDCMALYEDYMYHMTKRMQEYVEDIKHHPCGCLDEIKYPDKKKSDGLCQLAKEENRKEVCGKKIEKVEPPCKPKEEEKPKPKEKVRCDCNEMLNFGDGCICLLPEPDDPLWEYHTCECNQTLFPCTCKRVDKVEKRKKKSRSNQAIKEIGETGESDINLEQQDSRIFKIDKFPLDWSSQLKLLKKGLEALAQDDYPVAKLPDCHKLPHFKIWLDMRAGKYISMAERAKLNDKSISLWNHIFRCHRFVSMPELGLTRQQLHKMTWARVNTYTERIADIKEDYYRRSKQAYISEMREFFPSTFHHELYNRSFRDCYFAYLPQDENHIHVFRPWQSFEIKDLSKRKSCL